MNTQEIKDKTVYFLNNIKKIIKETFTLPYAKTYVFVSLLLIITFIIITFPYNALIRSEIKKMEKRTFKNINVQNIDFNFFDDIIFDNCDITLKNGNQLSFKNLSIDASLNPFSIFISNRILAAFKADRVNLKSDKFETTFDLNSNLDLTYKTSSNYPVEQGHLKIMINNALVKIEEIRIPSQIGTIPVKIPALKIKAIIASFELDKKSIKIDELNISGNDIRGNIEGTILVSSANINNSKLDLKLRIDADSAVLKDYKDMLTKYIDDKNNILIPLKGTLNRPKPEL